jgi:hypothetical protein
MSESSEPLVAPFRIIADYREALAGWRFQGLRDESQPDRMLVVPLEYEPLEFADYTVEGLPLFIVRKDAKAFEAALRDSPAAVFAELQQIRDLEATGASCFMVIEGEPPDLDRLIATELDALTRAKLGIALLFAPSNVVEQVVFGVIHRAWLREQTA